MKKEYFVIFIILVTEVLGFSLILPFLPFFAQDLGADALTIGLIFASFSLFQFFSAPVLGKLSDRYGRRPLLMLSQLVTCVSFVILGLANTVWLIFLSRIIDGLFGSNFTIAQAYLSDISSRKDRSKAFGISGAAFGVGFLIGPGIGGWLAQYGYWLPSFLAAGMALVTIALTYFFLPESLKHKRADGNWLDAFEFSQYKRYLANRKVAPGLWVFFTFMMSHAIFVSMMALYAERQLGLGPASVGLFLTYVGVNAVVLRGGLLPKLIDWCGEKRLAYMGVVATIMGLGATAFITEWWMFIPTITLFAFGSGVLRPVLIGEISRRVRARDQGELLGVSNSMGSVTQIIGPLAGGLVLEWFWPGSMALLASGVMAVGLVLMIRQEKNWPFLKRC